MIRRRSDRSAENGQILVLFAMMLPAFLAMGAIAIGVGNWYTHGRHLQTKADAGALAGGGSWAFPCGDEIDARIADAARLYAGSSNPQVGHVADSDVHTVLNGPEWYDDDSNTAPSENLAICDALSLDVKVTEDNSFPLFSLLPIFPDIKRKAVVELFEAEGLTGVLPIAVRAPEPVSAMAIFYNEVNGAILGRKYFVRNPGMTGLPAGLQGWTTENAADPNAQGWANVTTATTTGVVVAISFRGACNTWDPPGAPPGITIQAGGPCFEDGLGPSAPTYATVNTLCNQGGAVQVANCYFAQGTYPNEVVQSGLHFIRGYSPGNVGGSGPPELRSAYLGPGVCTPALSGYGSGYFAAAPNVCSAQLSANIDAGTCLRGPGQCVDDPSVNPPVETRTAANVEVKYTLIDGPGNNDDTCDFGNTCDLNDSGSSQISANTLVTLPADETRVAVGLRIRLQRTFVPGKPSCGNNNFNGQCEWYFRGSLRVDTQPSNAIFFADPVQRAFRGNSITSSSLRWLRLKADRSPCTSPVPADEFAFGGAEGSQPVGVQSCFVVEMGLKGGLAADADEQPILFNDGVGRASWATLTVRRPGHRTSSTRS